MAAKLVDGKGENRAETIREVKAGRTKNGPLRRTTTKVRYYVSIVNIYSMETPADNDDRIRRRKQMRTASSLLRVGRIASSERLHGFHI